MNKRVDEKTYALFVPGRIDAAFMLVSPHDQVQEGREEAQRNRATTSPRLAILMNQKQVKPIAFFTGLVERDLVLLKHTVESLVGNVAHTVQG